MLIVKTAIDTASESTMTIIVGEGVYLLVLMTQLTPTDTNFLILKPGIKYQNNGSRQRVLYMQSLKSIIMFLHAFCG